MQSIPRIPILAVVFLSVFLTACSERETTVNVANSAHATITADSKEPQEAQYTNKPRGFRIRMPLGWNIEDLGSPADGQWDLLLINPVESENNAAIHLTVFTGGRAVEVYSRVKGEFTSQGVNRIVSEGTNSVANSSSRFFIVNRDDFESRYTKVFSIPHGDRTYVFRCSMDELQDEATLKILERVVSSLQFERN